MKYPKTREISVISNTACTPCNNKQMYEMKKLILFMINKLND
jgi:hypothetical protein